MAEELPTYTREELDQMSRVKLRQTAVNYGKSHREATSMESDDIKDFILGKQGGSEDKKASGRKGKSNGKSATKARRKGKDPDPDPEPEEKDSGSDETRGAAGKVSDLIHSLGLGMDDGFKEVKDLLESLQAENEELRSEILEVQHGQFLLNGLVTDILSGQWEPKDVEERVADLEDIWQQQQSGDDEGND